MPFASLAPPWATGPSLSIRILTYNIRNAALDLFENEKPWSVRFPLVLSQLAHETRFLDGSESDRPNAATAGSALICLQEALHNQLVDILAGLNGLERNKELYSSKPANGPLWAHVGVGRDDGDRKGEYNPIIYPVRLYKLLHSETVWLSPTPDKPSRGWDAGSIRILTIAVFEHKGSGKRILACNTHLDNDGSLSREKSVTIILKTIQRVRKEWSDPSSEHHDHGEVVVNDNRMQVFLAGDFNSFPDQEAYQKLNSSGLMQDLRDLVKDEEQYGEEITFTGFEPDKHKEEQGRIDFLWLGPANAVCGEGDEFNERIGAPTRKAERGRRCLWQVQGYAVLPNVFDAGVYSSDHRCVVGDVILL